MAIIRVELAPRDQAEREAIMAELTEVMVRHGSPPESTQVLLYEVEMDRWAKGGVPYSKRSRPAAPQDG